VLGAGCWALKAGYCWLPLPGHSLLRLYTWVCAPSLLPAACMTSPLASATTCLPLACVCVPCLRCVCHVPPPIPVPASSSLLVFCCPLLPCSTLLCVPATVCCAGGCSQVAFLRDQGEVTDSSAVTSVYYDNGERTAPLLRCTAGLHVELCPAERAGWWSV
jgi:hypothetical protein